MPIMALFRSPFVDEKLYDAIIQELDLEHHPAAGGLVHACGFDDKGICVMDVWETRSEFEAFLADRLKPAFAKLDISFTAPEIIDGYAFAASDGVDRYQTGQAAGFGAARETGPAREHTEAAPN